MVDLDGERQARAQGFLAGLTGMQDRAPFGWRNPRRLRHRVYGMACALVLSVGLNIGLAVNEVKNPQVASARPAAALPDPPTVAPLGGR